MRNKQKLLEQIHHKSKVNYYVGDRVMDEMMFADVVKSPICRVFGICSISFNCNFRSNVLGRSSGVADNIFCKSSYSFGWLIENSLG